MLVWYRYASISSLQTTGHRRTRSNPLLVAKFHLVAILQAFMHLFSLLCDLIPLFVQVPQAKRKSQQSLVSLLNASLCRPSVMPTALTI